MEQISIERQNRRAEQRQKKEQNKQVLWSEIFDWVESIVFALVTVIVIFTFLFRIVIVSGESMTNTLQDGDRLILNSMFYSPEQGDIVVVAKESFRDGEPIIKRIIATEGQSVNINPDTGIVSVDGVELQEDYIKDVIDSEHLGDWDYPVTVPQGCIFVMGDNRNGSLDSRRLAIGMVKLSEVKGHAVMRLFPLSKFGGLN